MLNKRQTFEHLRGYVKTQPLLDVAVQLFNNSYIIGGCSIEYEVFSDIDYFIEKYNSGDIDNFIYDDTIGFITLYNNIGCHHSFAFCLFASQYLNVLNGFDYNNIGKLSDFFEDMMFRVDPNNQMEIYIHDGTRAYNSSVSYNTCFISSDMWYNTKHTDILDIIEYDLNVSVVKLKTICKKRYY